MNERTLPVGCLLPLVFLAVVAGVLVGGCDDPVDLLGQVTGYTGAVSAGMSARGWSGFPSDPISLARYLHDLRASLRDARDGVEPEGLGDGAELAGAPEVDRETLRSLGEAFGLPGQTGSRARGDR